LHVEVVRHLNLNLNQMSLQFVTQFSPTGPNSGYG
jgi:hypothetical protein